MRVQLQAVSQNQNTVTFRPEMMSAQSNFPQTTQALSLQQGMVQSNVTNQLMAQANQAILNGQLNPTLQQLTYNPTLQQALVPTNAIINSTYPLQPTFGQAIVATHAISPTYPLQPIVGQAFVPQQQIMGNLVSTQQSNIIQPSVDLSETSSEVVLACELPNADQRNINISLNDNSVSIQAQSGQGIYHRVVSLPTDIRPELCEATLTNGVLEIKMPKSSQARRKVNVNETLLQ
ncbi:Hsp20 family protein [Bacillus sp. BRMEA1]|uniref:Hsp20/alpha crystallin family protein n=1 Tax=Neobacillus endophyticus TaxID=2738405 RepID=UPI001565E3EC|nr:Hsp20/alpha crystallin family protein [Neobacillus endophyticus]NRD80935.1 Hsp20 family protein [Neobacillus endophyticus]